MDKTNKYQEEIPCRIECETRISLDSKHGIYVKNFDEEMLTSSDGKRSLIFISFERFISYESRTTISIDFLDDEFLFRFSIYLFNVDEIRFVSKKIFSSTFISTELILFNILEQFSNEFDEYSRRTTYKNRHD